MEKQTRGEEFWEAVDAFEKRGYSHAKAISAAHILISSPAYSLTEEKMWAISFPVGRHRSFYTGTYLTRVEAKREHSFSSGKTWEECEKNGDKVERVTISNSL